MASCPRTGVSERRPALAGRASTDDGRTESGPERLHVSARGRSPRTNPTAPKDWGRSKRRSCRRSSLVPRTRRADRSPGVLHHDPTPARTRITFARHGRRESARAGTASPDEFRPTDGARTAMRGHGGPAHHRRPAQRSRLLTDAGMAGHTPNYHNVSYQSSRDNKAFPVTT